VTDVIKFSSVKIRVLFNDFLSIKIPWVRTFFTDLEIVFSDGHVVSGNLLPNSVLHDLYEFVFM
jgi:hypothetical protein